MSNVLNYPDTVWLCIDPDRTKKGELAPLVYRLDEAANIYQKRMSKLPNTALLRHLDFTDAPHEHVAKLPNGKTARIKVELSPFGGSSREILIARRE